MKIRQAKKNLEYDGERNGHTLLRFKIYIQERE